MMFVALIMRPCLLIMEAYDVVARVLAGDVLMMAHGANMLPTFVKAANATHVYLENMGARIAPD